MKLHLHDLDGLAVIRDNVADPFHANPDGTARLRDATAASGIELCDRLEDADVAGLPIHWHRYPADRRAEVHAFIERAAGLQLQVLLWVNGDDEIDLRHPNLILFQHAVRRSRRRPYEVRIYPPFVEDNLEILHDGDVAPRPRGPKPSVGFCGQARPVPVDEAKRIGHKALARARWLAGRTESVPEPWPSHVLLRSRVLTALADSPEVDTDFVLRDRYRAGVESQADRRDPTITSATEFFDNVRRTTYTVCVRGGGNFSLRLAEAACFGRIPLVVDQDSILPFPTHPFWRDTAVLIPAGDPSRVVRAVVSHHRHTDEDGLRQAQADARAFWVDRLSMPGYFSHFREAIEG